MASFLKDLRYTLRTLVRKPAFPLMVIVILAVGIGASTAIISVADAVLLRPLPFPDPERLVFIWDRLAKTGVEKSAVASPDLVDFMERTESFAGVAGFVISTRPIAEEGLAPESIQVAMATSNFFSVLGEELFLGEMFKPEDEGHGDAGTTADAGAAAAPEQAAGPLILSYGLWQRRYGGDPAALGRSVVVNGQKKIIQGVAAKGFRLFLPPDAPFAPDIDAWTPFAFPLRTGSRTTQWLTAYGRLKPGRTLSDAQGEMDNLAAWQREQFEFHESVGMEIRVVPMHEDVTGHMRLYLIWFLAAAGLLLLLVFANVTNLMVLRGWSQRREISIRAAMGGLPGRLAGRMLLEVTLLAAVGGALGVLLARVGIRVLLVLQPDTLPRLEEATMDWTVLAATLGMVLLAAAVCGLVPAIQSSRIDLAAVLSERSSTGSPSQQWLRKSLVMVEIAISVFLLVNTGLVLRSFSELSRVDPGFRPDRVLTAMVNLPYFKYTDADQRTDFYEQVVRQAAAIPGVESVGGGHPLPLSEQVQLWWGPWATEEMGREEWSKNEADYRQVLPGYFETMGIRLLKGRLLTEADNQRDVRWVAVVDDVFARRAWPGGGDPVGRRLQAWQFADDGGLKPTWVDIVGVVSHVRDENLTRDGRGAVYCPYRFFGFAEMSLTLKSATSDPLSLADPLQQVVRDIDPDQPLTAVRLMQDYVDDALNPTRFALTLIGVFAAIATILATVGLYGVVSSFVQQRHHEFGIRMAFGARQGTILRGVLREAMVLTASGVVLGLFGAFFLTRGLSSLLFEVTVNDPLTFVLIPVIQVAIAVTATLIPAWRATRVDPVEVLHLA